MKTEVYKNVRPSLINGSLWVITNKNESKIDAMEMRFIRRIKSKLPGDTAIKNHILRRN